jgi:2-methylcitrate dehydratase PrpD
VHTRDGRELTHFVPAQKGGPGNPLTWDEIAVKFEANASAVLPQEHVAKLITMIGNLEAVEDAAELLKLCRTAA